MKGNGKSELLVDLVEQLVKGLVDNEDDVVVEVELEKRHTNLVVQVSPPDFGKVLGRKPRHPDDGVQTIVALRHLIKMVGNKHRLPDCTIYLEDPRDAGDRRRFDPRRG